MTFKNDLFYWNCHFDSIFSLAASSGRFKISYDTCQRTKEQQKQSHFVYKSNFRVVLCAHKCRIACLLNAGLMNLTRRRKKKYSILTTSLCETIKKTGNTQCTMGYAWQRIAYEEGSLSFNYRHGGMWIFEWMWPNTFALRL